MEYLNIFFDVKVLVLGLSTMKNHSVTSLTKCLVFPLETQIIKQSNSDGLGKVQTLLPYLIPRIATMGRFNRIEHQS